jgi:hypothetical protein
MNTNDISSATLLRIVASVILLFFTAEQAGADDRQFAKLYDFYFPRDKKDLEASFYRRGFDETLFGPPPKPGQERRHVWLYFAFHNDPSAFHKFVHNADRDGAGEFSETWIVECLVLLLRLGDDRFAKLLAREDAVTRETVGAAIEIQVNWKKHSFPKTRGLYSYRYVSPSRSLKH